MKSLIISIVLLFFSVAQADGEFKGKIHKGNKIISASGFLSYTTYSGSTLSLGASEEYFLKDGFALGAAVDIDLTTSFNSIFVGPSARHYFYSDENSALYWGASLMYYVSPNGYLSIRPVFGYDYFVAPNISFGPSLKAYINMASQNGYYSQSTSMAIFANFTLFF